MSKFLFFLCVLSLALSTTAFAQDAPVTDCDTYAGSDQDPQRKTAGMPLDRINPALAVPRAKPRCDNIRIAIGSPFNWVVLFTKPITSRRQWPSTEKLPIRGTQLRKTISAGRTRMV
jgi:hypothetical protein